MLKICRALEVSKSGYYAWKTRSKSAHAIDNEKLLIEIRREFIENDKTYGSPRIWNELKKAAIACSENRVARLMRKDNLVAVQKKKYKATTDSKHNFPIVPNILSRNFLTDGPNKVWVADMTYIWTWEGWLYLAFILDLFHRGVVGLAMMSRMTMELTQNALRQAIMGCNPPAGLIHHSDRGSQYAGGDYQKLLTNNGIIPSMSRKGNCWDNAVGESFVHTLKVEKINRYRFRKREDAMQVVFEYVWTHYNRKRTHSALGYMSPFEYQNRFSVAL